MASLSGAHGDWKYHAQSFRRRVYAMVEKLPEVMAVHNADCIAVCGTSGVAIASALMYFLPDLKVCMVRKESDTYHGHTIEGNPEHEYARAVFLDDFVCTGATLLHVISRLDYRHIEIVAVMCHHKSEDPEEYVYGRHTCEVGGLPMYAWRRS